MDTPHTSRDQRRTHILHVLEQHRHVTVDVLAQRFGVSTVTIRNDLDHFARLGLVVRTHGGAMLAPETERELTLTARTQQHPQAKSAIGRYAARLIKDHDIIALDSSSTSLAIVPYLARRRALTIVTNSLAVAFAVADFAQCTTMLYGGQVRNESQSVINISNDGAMAGIKVTIGFFGAHGISAHDGLIEISPEEAAAKRVIHQICQHNVALLDSSKLNRYGPIPFIPLPEIQTFISDTAADTAVVNTLREHGVHCFLAE